MNHEDCGAPSGRVRILMGSLSAPRFSGDVFEPYGVTLTAVSAAPR